MKPIFQAIEYVDPQIIYAGVSDQPGALWFDGLGNHGQPLPEGRYSYVLLDPVSIESFRVSADGGGHGQVLQQLQQRLDQFVFESRPNLPPFQGGLAGYLSYELAHDIECLPRLQSDGAAVPDVMLGVYDVVIGFDHHQQQAFVMSCGYPEQQPKRCRERAQARLNAVCDKIEGLIAPLCQNQQPIQFCSNFTQERYIQQVSHIQDLILAGDVFEVNLAQCFKSEVPQHFDCFAMYQQLRRKSLAPYSAYLNFGDLQVASMSPECFLQVDGGGRVRTFPIKGTAKRQIDPIADQDAAAQLTKSCKDRAENIMIVDLMRNDLSKVCIPESVQVKGLCELKSFPSVHHLVSTIEAQLKPAQKTADLLKATFPPGSITGAPKVRAMEIIADCEQHLRGVYCGSVLAMGFDGFMTSSVAIRTLTKYHNTLSLHGGGAVVLDSDPQQEYQETLDKVQLILDHLSG